MLDLSPEKFLLEIRQGEDYRDRFIRNWHEDLAKYHGPGYRPQDGLEDTLSDPENHSFEWISLVVPQLVFGNPRVKVSSARSGPERSVALAMQFGLNRWIKDTNLRKLNEKLAIDFGLKWAVALTMPSNEEGFSEREDPRNWPSVRRISPRRFLWDAMAEEVELARWMGHIVVRDKDDLLREAQEFPERGWNTEAIESLTVDKLLDDMHGDFHEAWPENRQLQRNEVAFYEVWIPEYNKDIDDKLSAAGLEIDEAYEEGKHHGIWVTFGLGSGQDASGAWVRKARRFWGPRWGPYTWIGCYVVPDEAAPLAPIPAVSMQAEELNDHARSLSRAMAVYKKGIVVDASDPNLANKIRDFEDHFVLGLEGVEDLDKKVKDIEIGGATEQHLMHQSILRQRLDRNSGISDVMRGNLQQDVTATAVASADESATVRLQFMVQKFRDGVQQILKTVSWYLYHDDEIVFPMGQEAEGMFTDEITGQVIKTPIFAGGSYEEDAAESFDSLQLEIEPYSMERTSEALQQRRMAELDATMLQIVPLMAQFPFVDWGEYMQMRGEFMNVPNLGDLFDVEMANQIAAAMLQLQLEGPTEGKAKATPRLSREVAGQARPKPVGGSRQDMAGVMSGVAIGSAGRRITPQGRNGKPKAQGG